MNIDVDVIIIGSGPAGVSAAFPLVKAGYKVLMIDGGKTKSHNYLQQNYLELRENDSSQTNWMIGEKFHALKMKTAISPKLRIPDLAYVFDSFHEKIKFNNGDFTVVGSLASGGLSNAWGAGVARFSNKEMEKFPFPAADLEKSYRDVGLRVGISGKSADDLRDYFGVDNEADGPVALDDLHLSLLNGYTKKRHKIASAGMMLGRSRVAVLTSDRKNRKACTLSGNCLWGCDRRSIYSAVEDLELLKAYPNFYFEPGWFADAIIRDQENWKVNCSAVDGLNINYFVAKKIILAAGTFSSTKLALKLLDGNLRLGLLSSPTAAFLLWLPKFFGRKLVSGFGLGQLSFAVQLNNEIRGFGSTFSTAGIPLSEFASHLPLRRGNAIDVLSALLSSCVVGNIFLPGHLTNASVTLLHNEQLHVEGVFDESVYPLMQQASSILKKSFFSMGGVILPGSFTLGKVGGDIHYAGTLPMRKSPQRGECGQNGELAGVNNIYIVDGAVLPILPEKSHTLTIMANADRIGNVIAAHLQMEKV